jgi:hypothetical protein
MISSPSCGWPHAAPFGEILRQGRDQVDVARPIGLGGEHMKRALPQVAPGAAALFDRAQPGVREHRDDQRVALPLLRGPDDGLI